MKSLLLTLIFCLYECSIILCQPNVEYDVNQGNPTDDISMNEYSVAERWTNMQGGSILPEAGVFTVPRKKVKIKGNFYLTPDFVPSKLYLKNGAVIDNMSARFNLLTNIIIFESEDDDVQGLLGVRIDEFEIKEGGKKRIFTNVSNYPARPLEYLGFYEVLVDSEAKLFSKRVAGLFRPTYFIALDIGEKSPKVYFRDSYYLYFNNQVHQITKFSKKDLSIFGPYRSEIKDYIKSEKLKFNRHDDLISLVNYFNELLIQDKSL